MNASSTETIEKSIAEFAAQPRVARSANTAELVDASRFLASLLIIWIHVPRTEPMIASTVVGRFAVPFFAFAAVFFATQNGLQKKRRSVWETAVSRFHRIYLPFVVWSAIYFAFKCAKLLIAPNQPNDFPGVEVLFVGTAYHLWFLPFVFLATIAAFAAAKWTPPNESDLRNVAFFAILIGIICCWIVPDHWPVDDGFKYAWQTTPAVMWAFAAAMIANRTSVAQLRMLAGSFATFSAAVSLLLLIVHGRNVVLENVAGMSLFVWAFWSTQQKTLPGWITSLAPLSFGIYLSHMLFIKIVETVTQKFGFGASVGLDVATFFVATAGSIVLCWSYRVVRARLRDTRLRVLFL